jgi:hypothetical protein
MGRERKGVVPLRFNLVPHRFLWASYGPDCMCALRMCVCATITFYPAIHSLLHVHFHNSSYQCPQQQWNVHTGFALAYINGDIDVADLPLICLQQSNVR